MFGICPFHQDHNPSFVVDDDKGRAVCFGCGWSGDQIAFVCDTFNISFKEAVEVICRRFGIPFGGMTTDEYLKAKAKIEEAKQERALKHAFHQECERVYQDLTAAYRAIENNPKNSLGLEHISGIVEMVMDELLHKEISRRVEALRYVRKWLLS